jgi:HK97 family phage prohead protease
MSTSPERGKIERSDMCRSVSGPFAVREEGDEGDGLTLDGYGAVFNSATRIDSWEGCFDELIAPGAFKKSLRERIPRMQFDHGMHPLIGSIPIGRFETIEEDARGLHVVGRLTDNWLVNIVRDAIRDGGVDGMSFRFSVVKEEWRDQSGKLIKDDEELWDLLFEGARSGDAQLTRTLKEVRCTEVGPVVWPAYENTEVGVRSKRITVDLGNRESLARAAFMIDAAVRNTETSDAPPPDGVPTESPEIPTIEPPNTDGAAAGDSPEPSSTAKPEAEGHSSDLEARTRRDEMKRRARELRKIAYNIQPLQD